MIERVLLNKHRTATYFPEDGTIDLLDAEWDHYFDIRGKEEIKAVRDLCNKALGGEYICTKCGIRQDMNPKTEPEF